MYNMYIYNLNHHRSWYPSAQLIPPGLGAAEVDGCRSTGQGDEKQKTWDDDLDISWWLWDGWDPLGMWHLWEKWGNFQVPAQEWKEKYSIECERRRKLLVKNGSCQAVVPLLEVSRGSYGLIQLFDLLQVVFQRRGP